MAMTMTVMMMMMMMIDWVAMGLLPLSYTVQTSKKCIKIALDSDPVEYSKMVYSRENLLLKCVEENNRLLKVSKTVNYLNGHCTHDSSLMTFLQNGNKLRISFFYIFNLKSYIHYRVSQKKYPFLTGNRNETIRYHYSRSEQLNLSIFNL